MRASFFKVAFATVIVLGAGIFAVDRLSPVGRISAAFPLSPQLLATRNAALKELPWGRKLPFLLELRRRMEQRALTCAGGKLPSWAAPLDRVINESPNPNCYIDVDRDLARWVGFVRLGPILRQPPLRPVPTAIAQSIREGGPVSAAHFPARAGVVLLEGEVNVAAFELATGKRLMALRKGNSQSGRLSPNGHIFLLEDWQGSRAVATETGATLAELPDVQRANFFWLDDRTAVFSPPNGDNAIVVDFETGQELPIPGQTRRIEAAVPVPGAPDQFVAGYARAVSTFKLERGHEQPRVTRLETRSFEIDWDFDNDGVTADGGRYIAADGSVVILDLQSLASRTLALGLFHAEQVIPTNNPTWVVLRGTVPFDRFARTRCYLYDLRDDTLAPLTCGERSPRQPLYLVPMRQYGAIRLSGIEPASLPYAPARPVAEQVMAWMDEDAAQRQQQAAREEEMRRTEFAADEARRRFEDDMQDKLRETERSLHQIRDPVRRHEALEQLRTHMRRYPR
jgi:hypothetical protein